MDKYQRNHIFKYLNFVTILVVFFLGLWLIVIKPLGPNLSKIPGDLGDARLNNYFLEHVFRRIEGLDRSLWNAQFFYPFPLVFGFSDNLIGSAPFYAVFRIIGQDRETAFQSWYILGYILNFAAALYVLIRLKLRPLSAALGAFFFTFGIPLISQEGHAQLLYRFAVPIVYLLIWEFSQTPKWISLAYLSIWFTWQFYLGIYSGIFLLILCFVLIVLLPFTKTPISLRELLLFWPRLFIKAWSQAQLFERISTITISSLAFLGTVYLLRPYYMVSKMYGLSRKWTEISSMLPRLQSYLLADQSLLYKSFSSNFSNIPIRPEHQLFPGIVVFALLLLGIVWSFKTEQRKLAIISIGCVGILVALTLYFNGYSLYYFFFKISGINSLRAITRIWLILMWPLALFIACVLDALSGLIRRPVIYFSISLGMIALLITESVMQNHYVYPKARMQARLTELRSFLPSTVPNDPILVVANKKGDPFFATEIDGMLLAQELGWHTINGYSGNFPPGFRPDIQGCIELPQRINTYLNFAKIKPNPTYYSLMEKMVPLGFTDCDPNWWQKKPPVP